MNRQIVLRSTTLIMTITALLAALVLIPSAPSSAAIVAPQTSTFQDSGPDYLSSGNDYVDFPKQKYAGDWTRYDTHCGIWGCSGKDHYFTGRQGATAWWYLGDFQGEFRLDLLIPEDENEVDKVATARLSVQVLEKRPGQSSYTVIRSTTLDQGNWNDNGGWVGWSNHLLLDGEVFVSVEVLSGYAGVSDARLSHEDVLPAHKELATEMCLISGAKQRNIALAIYYGAVGAIATAGVGAGPAIVAGIASAGLTSTATEYLLDQRLELLDLGACKYKNELFSWIHAYIAFSNDIAEMTLNNQAYESLGKTFCLSRGSNVSKYDPVTTDDAANCS